MKHLPIFDTPSSSRKPYSFDYGYKTPIKPPSSNLQTTQNTQNTQKTIPSSYLLQNSRAPAFHSGDIDCVSPFTRQPSPFETKERSSYNIRKMSIDPLSNKNQRTIYEEFLLSCPKCKEHIYLLDAQSSKAPNLEKKLKEMLSMRKNSINNDGSFISSNGNAQGFSNAFVEFEGKDLHIEQKYGKYLKKCLHNNQSACFDSPLASRNLLNSNKKSMKSSVDPRNENENCLRERVKELEEELFTRDEEIRRLNEVNKRMIQEMNGLMRIKLL